MKKIYAMILIIALLSQPTLATLNQNSKQGNSYLDLVNSTYESGLGKFKKSFKLQGYKSPYNVTILFDESHNQYYDSSRLSTFLQMLHDQFNASIVIHKTGELNDSVLSGVDILILPDLEAPMSSTEINAVKTFLQNNGSLLISATWFRYFEPTNFTQLTRDFGIDWYDGEVLDNTTNDGANYYPIIHNWTNTELSKFLTGNNLSLNVLAASSAPLRILKNTSQYTVFILGRGDNDTYVLLDVSGNNSEILQKEYWYGNTTVFAASMLSGGGRIFASGSTSAFRDGNIESYNNTLFAMNMIRWLMAEGLEITNITIPSDVKAGDVIYVNVTIKNNENIDATNVKTSIEFVGGVKVLNASQEYTIGTLTAGNSIKITWELKLLAGGNVKLIFKTWSDNLRGYSDSRTFNVFSYLSTEATFSPLYFVKPDITVMTINVTNKQGSGTTTTANITITLPNGFTANVTEKTNININEGGSYILHIEISITGDIDPGPQTVKVLVNTTNLGYLESFFEFYAFERRVAVYYQPDVGYYRSSKMTDFLNYVSTYLDVFVANTTITSELLDVADLVILPEPDNPLSTAEINLFKDWVNNGGKLLVVGDWYNYFEPDNVNPLTSQFGIVFNDGEIMDDTNNYDGLSYAVNLSNFAVNPYATYIKKKASFAIFWGCTYLNLTAENVYPIIFGNPTSYGVDSNGEPIEDLTGEKLIAMAITETEKGGMLVASGTAYLFRSDGNYKSLYSDVNKPFVQALVDLMLKGDLIRDFEPPKLEVTAPANFSLITTAGVDITWTASDNYSLVAIKIYVNDELVATLDNITTSYNFKPSGDGLYFVRVVAEDWVGYTNESLLVLFVDEVPPNVQVVEPANNTYTSETSVTIEWSVDDPVVAYIGNITIYVDGTKIATVPGDTTSYTLTLSEGVHVIEIKAFSKATVGSTKIVLTVDLSGPEITLVEPANGSTLSSGTFSLVLNISDLTSIQKVEVYIDGALYYTNSTINSKEATLTIQVENLGSGQHTITVKAYDIVGNSSEENYVVTVRGGLGASVYLIIGVVVIVAVGVVAYFFFKRRS